MDADNFKFGTYRHYKSDLYTAIALVTHHQTRQPMVLYVSHARGCVNCRPLHGWAGDPDGFCDPVTMIDGTSVPRFELLQEASP
jgi:hypothetical protein